MPVIVREIDNPLEAELILIDSNRQREKTPSERMHESENLTRIFAEEARRKMLAGVTADGAGGRGHKANPRPTLDEGSSPARTDAAVAESVGMKPRTYGKTAKRRQIRKPADSVVPTLAQQNEGQTLCQRWQRVGVAEDGAGGRGRPKTDDSSVATLPQSYGKTREHVAERTHA